MSDRDEFERRLRRVEDAIIAVGRQNVVASEMQIIGLDEQSQQLNAAQQALLRLAREIQAERNV